MFLYENNGQFIDVYKLEPKSEEIKKYKMNEMEKIPKRDRVWKAVTNNYNERVLERHSDLISAKQLEFNERIRGYKFFHKFFKSKDSQKNIDFLNTYFEDNKTAICFRKIEGYDTDRYIVQLQSSYSTFDLWVMDGIIYVPESLYLLEALLNNRFDLVGDKDVTEQLKLFDVQHYGRINIDVLKNICDYEILLESYDSIINRTESNKNILSKVKKLAR